METKWQTKLKAIERNEIKHKQKMKSRTTMKRILNGKTKRKPNTNWIEIDPTEFTDLEIEI